MWESSSLQDSIGLLLQFTDCGQQILACMGFRFIDILCDLYSDGRVELIKSWRDCGRTRESEKIEPILSSSKLDEFILTTGKNGKCRAELAQLFVDSAFGADVRALKQSQPFIGYLNRKTGKYDSVIGKVGGDAMFALVNSKIYNKKFN